MVDIGVKVYSDADFPHWLGWAFIDDDTEGHSRCDSMQLLDLIESMIPAPGAEPERPIPQDGAAPGAAVIEAVSRYRNRLTLAYAKTQTGELRDRLTHCVVKMPTETPQEGHMRMLLSTVVVLIALVPGYTSGAALDDSILSTPEFDIQRELRGVGSCRFTIERQSRFEEYRLGYGREKYATYLTKLPGIRPTTAITLTLGCASDDNGDIDSAMALNDNIIKSSRIGHWSLSKRAARQRAPKLVVTNVANGTTRGYVLMAIPDKVASQGNLGFCVTNQQQVLCGGASLSAHLLHGRAKTSLVDLIQGIRLVPSRKLGVTR
ncbi:MULTISPECIES: hypothetical protein [Burkholderia]|nr:MULTISPECIES: hypothetical protein [Burkholderia]